MSILFQLTYSHYHLTEEPQFPNILAYPRYQVFGSKDERSCRVPRLVGISGAP